MTIKIKRIFASVIDFYVACLVGVSLISVVTLGRLNISALSMLVYLLSVFSCIVLKDLVFKNASIGKRIFGIIIIKTNGTPLCFSDLFKRNILIILLMALEVIFLVLNGKRIGDTWSKTTVVEVSYQ